MKKKILFFITSAVRNCVSEKLKTATTNESSHFSLTARRHCYDIEIEYGKSLDFEGEEKGERRE